MSTAKVGDRVRVKTADLVGILETDPVSVYTRVRREDGKSFTVMSTDIDSIEVISPPFPAVGTKMVLQRKNTGDGGWTNTPFDLVVGEARHTKWGDSIWRTNTEPETFLSWQRTLELYDILGVLK